MITKMATDRTPRNAAWFNNSEHVRLVFADELVAKSHPCIEHSEHRICVHCEIGEKWNLSMESDSLP